MKTKIVISFFFFLHVCEFVQAQDLCKSTKFWSANISKYNNSQTESIESITESKYSKNGWSASTGIGVVQSSKLSLGFRINYTYSSTDSFIQALKTFNTLKSKTLNNFWGISTFARYNQRIYKSIFIFLEGNCSIGNNTQKNIREIANNQNRITTTDNVQGNFGNSISVTFKPGILLLIRSRIGIEFCYGNWNYLYTNFQPSKGSGNENVPKSASSFNFKTSSLNFGLNYFFRKKVKHTDTSDKNITSPQIN